MSQIPESLKQRYATLSQTADASIHRHPQPDIATELRSLADATHESEERDTYGAGGTISQFEQQLSKLFNKPSCVFLPTGTLAQCVAMKCYSEYSGKTEIGLHPTSHLLLHEHMAIEKLWSLNAVPVGSAQRVICSDDLEVLTPNTTAAIIIELPMREIGGALPAWEALLKIRGWCDTNDVKMHLDGARIWQITEYYRRSLAQIASVFDSIYISFYKDMGGIIGAALLGGEELIEQGRIWARRAGGNPITQYPEAIAARRGLQTYLDRMPGFVQFTASLCELLAPLPLKVSPEQPKASMFHLRFALSPKALALKIVQYVEKTGILVLPLPRSGEQEHCICEITIGDNALAKSPEFWAEHIAACLTADK